MIRDKLIPLLEEKFGASAFTIGERPGPVIVFAAAHSEVGNLEVLDDKTEAIVSIGEITHGQFYCFVEGVTQDEIEQEVAESVSDFIEDLFNGKYVLWRSPRGAGGWRHVDYTSDQDRFSYLEEGAQFFTWSGPLQTEGN